MEGMWRRLVSCACILVLWQALYLLNVHVIAAVHGWENAYSEGLPPPYINIPSQFNLHLISFCTDTDAQAQVGTLSHRFSLAQNVKNDKHTNTRAHPNLETHRCAWTHTHLGWVGRSWRLPHQLPSTLPLSRQSRQPNTPQSANNRGEILLREREIDRTNGRKNEWMIELLKRRENALKHTSLVHFNITYYCYCWYHSYCC